MLNSNLLAVHRAVVDEGSLTRAADLLGFSVSAVSQQLAQLQAQAGCELFERAGRGVRPTPAGLLLAEHASRVLAEIQDAQTALADLRAGRAGRLRVITFPSAGVALLPPAISGLRETLPGVSIRPSVDEAQQALRRLRAGDAELVIVVEPYTKGAAPHDDLHRWHLLDDEYRIALSTDHPLARKRTIGVEELSDSDWVITGPDDYVLRTTQAICRRAGFSPRIGAESDEFPVTQGFVAAGLGVALIPLVALPEVRAGVAVRKLRPAPEPRHIWVATRPSLREHVPVVELVAALRAAARHAPTGG